MVEIPIPPSEYELRSHFEPLDLRWNSSQYPRERVAMLLLVIPPCPAVQQDLLDIIVRRRNWYKVEEKVNGEQCVVR